MVSQILATPPLAAQGCAAAPPQAPASAPTVPLVGINNSSFSPRILPVGFVVTTVSVPVPPIAFATAGSANALTPAQELAETGIPDELQRLTLPDVLTVRPESISNARVAEIEKMRERTIEACMRVIREARSEIGLAARHTSSLHRFDGGARSSVSLAGDELMKTALSGMVSGHGANRM